MSWTTEVDKARWFADRWHRTTGRATYVYTTTAEPAAVLADVAAVEPGGRLEAEIVVDPSMLGRLRRL
jgi:hypothetical protein